MSYLYRLAGDDMELAEADLNGFLESQGLEEAERHGRIALTDSEPEQLRRLALTHEVSRLEWQGDIDDFRTDYRPEGSFAVRVHGAGNSRELQERIGRVLETEENSVDLENPENVLNLYITEEKAFLGEQVDDLPRGKFEERKNHERPFSSPVSLDPSLARLLVNLSAVPAGGHVLDPFCGTGGILIEAGLCGIGVHGLDIQEDMVSGTEKNLEEYGIIAHEIREGEVSQAREIFDQEFDAVITDLPYGKASRKEQEPVKEFLEVAPDLTDGKIVFMSDQSQVGEHEPEYEVYVHRNLTRYIYVV
ncbi:MAG: methyltransferase domain-containing protein [Candidatus Nanohaloarchaea archaeon]